MITVDKIMSNDPCWDYTEDMIKEMIGDGKTPLEILDLDIPAQDRIWVLTRKGVLPDDVLRLMARRFALSVIHLWDAPDVVVQYLETGDESLRSAAYSAAMASWDATGNYAAWAASGAAMDAAMDAAYAALAAAARAAYAALAASGAAMDAAMDAAWGELIEIIRDILNGAFNENE